MSGNMAEAQKMDSLLLLNSRGIDVDRYKDFRGSPYTYKEFVPGAIVFKSGHKVEVDELNYNGYGHTVEVRNNDKFIEMDPGQCLRVEINVKGNASLEKIYKREKIILQKGLHPNFRKRFVDLIYLGENLIFMKDLYVGLKEQSVNAPGEKIEFKGFRHTGNYYLLVDGELKAVKLKKKSFLKALDKSKELDKFIKKNKTDFKSDMDVIALLTYYDGLLE